MSGDESAKFSGLYWPKGEPEPTAYVRLLRRPIPCRRCHRIRLDTGQVAVIVNRTGKGFGPDAELSGMKCRGCGEAWEVPTLTVHVREIVELGDGKRVIPLLDSWDTTDLRGEPI